MNWDQIEGKWSQIRGEIRQKWGRLTDMIWKWWRAAKTSSSEGSRSATESPKKRPSGSLTNGSKLSARPSLGRAAGLRRFLSSNPSQIQASIEMSINRKGIIGGRREGCRIASLRVKIQSSIPCGSGQSSAAPLDSCFSRARSFEIELTRGSQTRCASV